VLNQDHREILSTFLDEELDFLVVGTYALAAHGLVRATGGLDLWVRTTPQNAARVAKALLRFGAPSDQFAAEDFTKKDLAFEIGVEPARFDVLTGIDGVSFPEAWHARVELGIDDLIVPVISREHLILNKKTMGRPQDLVDLAELEASGD
jgi:hypothetical protein